MTATETTRVVQIQKGPQRSKKRFWLSEKIKIRAKIQNVLNAIHSRTWILLDDVVEERLPRSRDHAGHDAILDVGRVDVEKLLVELHGPKVVLARLAGGQETYDLMI